jgi:hypothetical protein
MIALLEARKWISRRWLWITAGAALLSVITLLLVGSFDPIRWTSEEGLHSGLLESTPLGLSKNGVQEFVESKGWKNYPGTKTSGLFGGYLSVKRIGDSAICAVLGSYQGFPVFVRVRAIWVFDQRGKLIDVEVYKDQDGLDAPYDPV